MRLEGDERRLGFLLERLEPAQGGAFDPAELARIGDIANYSASKGIKVILDPHNFGEACGSSITGPMPTMIAAEVGGQNTFFMTGDKAEIVSGFID